MNQLHTPHLATYLIAAAVAFGTVSGCSRNVGEPPPDERPPSVFDLRVVAAEHAPVTAPTRGVLFVGARPASGGPPVYVARYSPVRLPSHVQLTKENRMGRGGPAPKQPMQLFARLDLDGDAGTATPQDWSGESDGAYAPGATGITITIAPQTAEPSLRLPVTIEGPPPPQEATIYVLIREPDGRVPLAAAKFSTPQQFPLRVELSERDFMRPVEAIDPQWEVLVKVDQDENPMTTVPGDLRGSAPAKGDVVVQLSPDTPQ